MEVKATKTSLLGSDSYVSPNTLLGMTLRLDKLVHDVEHTVCGGYVLQDDGYVLYHHAGLERTLVVGE